MDIITEQMHLIQNLLNKNDYNGVVKIVNDMQNINNENLNKYLKILMDKTERIKILVAERDIYALENAKEEYSKKSSIVRSADFYLDALELSIAQATLDGQNITDNTYNILDNGNLCLSYDASDKCIEELKVEVKGETPKEGTITIKNGQISSIELKYGEKTIVKNSDGDLVYQTVSEEKN